jgi:hypothetical protein
VAVRRNSIVIQHPDSLAPVSGVQIPEFDRMLEITVGVRRHDADSAMWAST